MRCSRYPPCSQNTAAAGFTPRGQPNCGQMSCPNGCLCTANRSPRRFDTSGPGSDNLSELLTNSANQPGDGEKRPLVTAAGARIWTAMANAADHHFRGPPHRAAPESETPTFLDQPSRSVRLRLDHGTSFQYASPQIGPRPPSSVLHRPLVQNVFDSSRRLARFGKTVGVTRRFCGPEGLDRGNLQCL